MVDLKATEAWRDSSPVVAVRASVHNGVRVVLVVEMRLHVIESPCLVRAMRATVRPIVVAKLKRPVGAYKNDNQLAETANDLFPQGRDPKENYS